ncbi:hypothetical protein EMCRGX_G010360 [Ephydatia muelleri]
MLLDAITSTMTNNTLLCTEEHDISRPDWAKASTDDFNICDLVGIDVVAHISPSSITGKQKIREGQFGEVFIAILRRHEPAPPIQVAMKSFKNIHNCTQEANFMKEMARLSQLVHPNIVQMYGIVIEGRQFPAMVMEYLPHSDLKTFLSNNPRSTPKLVKYMIDIAMAMNYVSEKGLIHRLQSMTLCLKTWLNPNATLQSFDEKRQQNYPTQEQRRYHAAHPSAPPPPPSYTEYPAPPYSQEAPFQSEHLQQQPSHVHLVIEQPRSAAAVYPSVSSAGDCGFVTSIVLSFICFFCGTWCSLCCTIPAIFVASSAKEAAARGDYVAARRNERTALALNIAAVVFYILFLALVIGLGVYGGLILSRREELGIGVAVAHQLVHVHRLDFLHAAFDCEYLVDLLEALQGQVFLCTLLGHLVLGQL